MSTAEFTIQTKIDETIITHRCPGPNLDKPLSPRQHMTTLTTSLMGQVNHGIQTIVNCSQRTTDGKCYKDPDLPACKYPYGTFRVNLVSGMEIGIIELDIYTPHPSLSSLLLYCPYLFEPTAQLARALH